MNCEPGVLCNCLLFDSLVRPPDSMELAAWFDLVLVRLLFSVAPPDVVLLLTVELTTAID